MTASDLVAYCRRELIPHALAEETTLYPAAAAVPDCIGSGQNAVQTVLDTLTAGRVTSAT